MSKRVHRVKVPLLGQFAWVRDDQGAATLPADMFLMSNLKAAHFRSEGPTKQLVDSYDLGSGVVTTAGVVLMAADWTSATAALKLAKNHDCGTGVTAEAIGNTALVTPYGGARAVGSQSNASNVYETIGTISFTSTLAITEWGLFTNASGATLWDRRVFSAINVVNGDSIQFTYDLTVTAGG